MLKDTAPDVSRWGNPVGGVCTGVHVVEIVLPYSANGFYRFGDLPRMIADATFPQAEGAESWLISVVAWLDDGSPEGLFTLRKAPQGVLSKSVADASAWPAEIVDLSSEPAHRPNSKYFNWLWHEQRRESEQQQRLADGSLVINTQSDQTEFVQVLRWTNCIDEYAKALEGAVRQRDISVCTELGLPHSFPLGQALQDSAVHIDTLNDWGKTLPGGQRFVMPGEPPEHSEPVTRLQVSAEAQKPPAIGATLPRRNPAPKDEANALRHCLTILAPLHTPDERKMMTLNVERRIAGEETALLAFRFRQLAALFYPGDREKADALESQMKADFKAGQLVSKIDDGQEGAFVADLAAWPNCPPIPSDSPLLYWLPHMAAKSGSDVQASSSSEDSIDRREEYVIPVRPLAVPAGLLSRFQAQETAILNAIKNADYQPKRLPANESGKRGVKAEVRQAAKEAPNGWRIAFPYIVAKLCGGQYKTAKALYNALEAEAGDSTSPFEKGVGSNRGSLFVREVRATLALKTVQNAWGELQDAAKKGR